ncbi:MAG: calcium/proton exchanger [Armatimonadota bacterium]
MLILMVIFVPTSVALEVFHANPALVFAAAAMAIIPLAGFMGQATEQLAKHLGSMVGGLLNATFGNMTELIIAIFAVRAGQLEVVRASLIGSIIGNILLVLGMAAFFGGLKHRVLKFNTAAAGSDIVQLFLAVVAILTPSLFVLTAHRKGITQQQLAASNSVEYMSLGIAGLLIMLYLGSLLFSLKTHQDIYCVEESDEEPARWSKTHAFVVLSLATIAVAFESEFLVGSIEPTVNALHMTPLFVGVILLPIIGNAAEHATAVTMAMRNKMDIALGICTSSSAQVALFVGPVIVFLSLALGHPMPFLFDTRELITVGFAVLIASFIARDGETNWFEGAQLLVVYAIFGLAYFFVA